MKKILSSGLFAFIILSAQAQIPATLSYQGLLTNASGVPVADGNHTVLFKFYTATAGGSPVFTRGTLTVATFKGLFTVILGNGQGSNNDPLPYTLGDSQYYIGIEPDGGAELTPRIMLTAVPYAFVASTVKAVDAATISTGIVPDARLSTHVQDLADGTLTGSKVGTGINATNITTGTLPASVLPTTSLIPIGTIIAFGGTTIPTGWLLCDGTEVSRTTYSALFTAMGVSWGGGNGSSTFNLPDLRGRFLRGRDGGAGNDPEAAARTALFPGTGVSTGDNIGSYQADAFQGHIHTWITEIAADGTGGGSISSGDKDSDQNIHTYFGAKTHTIITDAVNGVPRISSESRSKNAYVNFIIKAQ